MDEYFFYRLVLHFKSECPAEDAGPGACPRKRLIYWISAAVLDRMGEAGAK
jgi:hypothetical protein